MWKNLSITALRRRRSHNEATTSANAGAFVVPLGVPLRSPNLVSTLSSGIFSDNENTSVSAGYQSVEDVLANYAELTKFRK